MTTLQTTVYCGDVDGEKKQWLLLDDGIFSVTKPMTTDEIKEHRGEKWYRPIVKYEQEHKVTDGVKNFSTEIHGTAHWLESLRMIEEMCDRNGANLGVEE